MEEVPESDEPQCCGHRRLGAGRPERDPPLATFAQFQMGFPQLGSKSSALFNRNVD